jgi:FixJ family two-component response regulator
MLTHKTGTVAIIDDDGDVGDVLGGLLEIVGYQVQTYRSGSDFITDIDPDGLACIVVDQNMPEMTGLEMLQRLDNQGVNIPSVLITGSADDRVVREAAELGVMKVLEKPMSHHELLRFIECSMA